MTERFYINAFFQHLTTAGAMGALCASSLGTGCRYALIYDYCVINRRDFLLLYNNLFTYGALLTLCISDSFAGRRYRLVDESKGLPLW